MFGWAKPVPVNAGRFRHPRQDMALVAAAGPAMNFLLAWLAALALSPADSWPGLPGDLAVSFLNSFIVTNLVLGLFNLLPIPPLDGGRIVRWGCCRWSWRSAGPGWSGLAFSW